VNDNRPRRERLSSARQTADSVLPRLAARPLRKALGVTPVVVLMGARQTGKSTLVQSLPPLVDRPYLALDDLTVRGQAQTAPDDLVRRAPRLTIDEIQREPDLILAIKRAVDGDRPRRAGRFVLTGSANLLLMRRVSETLAGRASYVSLWPLTRRERMGLGKAGTWSELFESPVDDWYDLVAAQAVPAADWRDEVRRGGYPVPAHVLASDEARTIWFGGYVQTYLERDLQDLAAIDRLVDFQRLMQAACLRLGTLVNHAELARDTAIPRPTVLRYLNLLETSYQLFRLQPYSVNRTKRLIKAPRLYWSDTGLALFLAKEGDPGGAWLENLILADLLAWRDAEITRPGVFYWRTASGEEVDFVIEHQRQLLPIEVKATARPSHGDARHLRTFCEEYGKKVRGGLLLHDGKDVCWISKGVLAAPWWKIV
jgi:predicted AAA+ superfamily ATPase